ncbi:hypothetical protein B0T16DRAFT_106284 [Cercophora newfieldiana]|uniref:Uncharacterized protein n=1 Tax=Cercophora newfieldiana TaxID=92897 RepID=A0AA39YJU7_9PEZI|nr:hypothetical protein B0T16DRAFT_106284 [Cercophora newfieldiana]
MASWRDITIGGFVDEGTLENFWCRGCLLWRLTPRRDWPGHAVSRAQQPWKSAPGGRTGQLSSRERSAPTMATPQTPTQSERHHRAHARSTVQDPSFWITTAKTPPSTKPGGVVISSACGKCCDSPVQSFVWRSCKISSAKNMKNPTHRWSRTRMERVVPSNSGKRMSYQRRRVFVRTVPSHRPVGPSEVESLVGRCGAPLDSLRRFVLPKSFCDRSGGQGSRDRATLVQLTIFSRTAAAKNE